MIYKRSRRVGDVSD